MLVSPLVGGFDDFGVVELVVWFHEDGSKTRR
jgi:hypothetical protein